MLDFKVTSEESPFILPVFCSERVFSRASWVPLVTIQGVSTISQRGQRATLPCVLGVGSA